MKIINTIQLKYKNPIQINFGIPDSQEELNEMFKLRFEIYKNKNYIDPEKFENNMDIDQYDKDNKCVYFIAEVNKAIIGTARLIIDYPLPTQIYFDFEEPLEIQNIPIDQRAEISRLVIKPYKLNNNRYLPRHITMLMLFKTIADYSMVNNYKAGYAFVKSRLFEKLKLIKIPFYVIKNYKQRYPKDGILYKYFNDPNDPVIPIYYFLDEITEFFEKIFNFRLFFIKKGNLIIMKNIFLYDFLVNLKRLL